MIILYNASKLTRQPFFQALINYLAVHEEVTLRQIKQAFPEEQQVDKYLESYIKAGYIRRENRRYFNAFSLLEDIAELEFDQEVFVDTESAVYSDLKTYCQKKRLHNDTNAVVIEEWVDFPREKLTLHSYFHKMRTQEALSQEQKALYAILGDVNPSYALKYMTSFLLKFTRKETVLQRRSDIFVETLLVLGYIEPAGPQSYRLAMQLDKERLLFTQKDES